MTSAEVATGSGSVRGPNDSANTAGGSPWNPNLRPRPRKIQSFTPGSFSSKRIETSRVPYRGSQFSSSHGPRPRSRPMSATSGPCRSDTSNSRRHRPSKSSVSTSWHCTATSKPPRTYGRLSLPAECWRKSKSPPSLSPALYGALCAPKIRSSTWRHEGGVRYQHFGQWPNQPKQMKRCWLPRSPYLPSPTATVLERVPLSESKTSIRRAVRSPSLIEKPATGGLHGQLVRTPGACWVSSGLPHCGSVDVRGSRSSKVVPGPFSRSWYGSSKTRNIHTSDGMHGAAWGLPCSYEMEPPCRNYYLGAAGDPWRSHAATLLDGTTVPGKIPLCHDLHSSRGRAGVGDLRKDPVPLALSGLPLSFPGVMSGSLMGRTTQTQGILARQSQRSCPSLRPLPQSNALDHPQPPPPLPYQIPRVPPHLPRQASAPHLVNPDPNPPPQNSRGNDPKLLSRPHHVPVGGSRPLWKTASNTSHPRPNKQPRVGGSSEYNDHVSHRPHPVPAAQRREWRSVLWRKARKIRLPSSLDFRRFWTAVYAFLLVICSVLVGPRPRSVQVVHMLFAAVDHMREADFLTATIVLSPTSPDPKRQSELDAKVTDSRGRPRVPVSIAEKGLGEAGRVPIPADIWDEVVHPESLEAMRSVQIPQPGLSVEVRAMVEALIRQNHVHVISDGMPGAGLHPSASTFLVPKSSEKCSFIVNCKSGNRRDPQPQPKMNLPNMWSLRQKFIRWSADPKARHVPRHACTFDIKNCFTSLCLPQQAWGTFRVQSPGGVCDLRTLPFGWKLSPPICQKVVARHLQESFKLMPPPPELPPDFVPDHDGG